MGSELCFLSGPKLAGIEKVWKTNGRAEVCRGDLNPSLTSVILKMYFVIVVMFYTKVTAFRVYRPLK